jgi:hypothetical protein
VQFLFLIAFLLQNVQPAPTRPVRSDRLEIIVPQGWQTTESGGGLISLRHSTGASLLVRRIASVKDLATYASQEAERVMNPLGFAKLGPPKHFTDSNAEWVEYEIVGNRLAEHKRILYRATRKNAGFFEFTFEAAETRFDQLLSEAQTIASSAEAIIEAPTVRRSGR